MSEAQKIHKYIIKSTPYGQLPEVLKDLNRVSPIDLASSGLLSTIEDYNQEHLAIVSGESKQFVLMASNKVEESQYIDQIESMKYTVDHIKQEIINTQPCQIQLMEEVKKLLIHLKVDVQKYVSEYYKTPNGVQVFADISQEGLAVHIGLTSKNISISKYYTGQWISKWIVKKDSVQGVVNIKAHFFEGGNVQFNQKRQLKQEFQFTEHMNENSVNIVDIIRKFEAEVQSSLDKIYEDMPEKFFKKLRRLAPYTKSKMNWNLNAIKMNHNILQGKNK